MKDNTKNWRNIAVIVGLMFGLMIAATPALAKGKTTHRPIEDFLVTQGTFCVDDGMGGCFLFVPPDLNFLGWTNDFDSPAILFAGVDYAGLANAYAPGKHPEISGTVTERPLQNGRTEVTVLLHTKNANVWVIELDLSGDILGQIAGKPTLFGHRPADVLADAAQALGDSFLQVVFTVDKPGDPLPDLVEINNGTVDLKFLAFNTRAKGPLTAEFGVPEGTPGRGMIIQTGLFMTRGQGTALDDGFPAENITLTVLGPKN